jgi:capsular polysaccharide biosynthesis protein
MTPEYESLRVISEASSKQLTSLELRAAFQRTASSFSDQWSGEVGGTTAPRWWAPDLIIAADQVALFSTENAFYIPSLGAVISASGEIFSLTVRHATYLDPKLEKIKQLWMQRASAPRIEEGIVTMSWGALHNYGHFVLDAMTSVAAIAQREELRKIPFVTPPLRDWQRQHFQLLNIEPLELPGLIYALGRVSFASGLKGSLHNPNLHFHTLRDAQLASIPSAIAGVPRIYISRQGQKRPMVNEAELEEALTEIGFAVVKPETMSVPEQIKVFSSAKIIVAPTGAGLANLLYAKRSTVFEIIPQDMTLDDFAHKWVAYLTAMGEGDWRPFFCKNLPDSVQPEIKGQKRAGYLPFHLSVADAISFIERTLV